MSGFPRREFIRVAGAGAVAYAAFPGCTAASRVPPELTFYVGTYTRGASEGIYRCTMDTASGALELKGVTGGIENPSYLAAHADRLYAVNETGTFEGEPGGGVLAYAIERETGELRLINSRSSHGGAPCYVTVTPQGGHVLLANYSGGNVAVYPIASDGGLEPASHVVQHEGSSIHPRQQNPHAHAVLLDAAGRYAFAVDLGIDKVMIYRFDAGQGRLEPGEQPWVDLAPGSGPRHIAFHPDGRRAYVINELGSTLTAFAYDPERGTLQETQTVSTLPEGFAGNNSTADVHVSPDGRFVYGSNRGHNSITVFAIDENTGALSLLQHESTRGEIPRNFAIDPTGRFLLAANQNTDNVVVFSLDSGRLTPTGHELDVPTPVCVRFV